MATGKPVLALMTSDSTRLPEKLGQVSASVSVGWPAVVVCVTVTSGIVAMMASTPARTWAFSGAAVSASREFIQVKLSACSFCCSGVSAEPTGTVEDRSAYRFGSAQTCRFKLGGDDGQGYDDP